MNQVWLYISIIASLISIGVAFYLFFWVKRQDPGTEKAKEVASWIREGAKTYLKRLYIALTIISLVLAFIIGVVFSFDLTEVALGNVQITPSSGIIMAIAFIAGAVCSAVAGYMGMSIAVEANVRTATAANESLNKAFKLSFYAGSVMGLAMVGLAVIGMSTIFLLTEDADAVLGFSFGASALALLAKAGGGIYTKTADIAADLRMIPVIRLWWLTMLVIM